MRPQIRVHYEFEEELEHYGVKGMKWGQHIFGKKENSEKVKKESKDNAIKEERRTISKEIRLLSSEDIRRYTDRLVSEQKLKDLLEADLHPARKFVMDTIKSNGSSVLNNFLKGSLAYAGRAITSKSFNLSDFGSYAFPKPKGNK